MTDDADTGPIRPLVTPGELAAWLQIPPATLVAWRYTGKGPAYVKVGRHIRYRPEHVEAWVQGQRRPAP